MEKQKPTNAAKMTKRSIFVLVDNTDESRTMWTSAQQNALQAGDSVTLVAVAHVDTNLLALASGSAVEGTFGGGNGRVNGMERQEVAAAKKEARQVLQAFLAEAQTRGWTVDTVIVTAKDERDGEALVKFLKTHPEADEVFIASKQMGKFKKTMMNLSGNGPVSDYVQRNAPCHVEVVKSGKHPTKTDARATLLTGM